MSVKIDSLKPSRADFRGICTKYNNEPEKLLILRSDQIVRLATLLESIVRLATLLESISDQITTLDLQIQEHTGHAELTRYRIQ